METVTPVFATVYLLSRLLLTQATVIFEHPQDVTTQPNERANFSCTVDCSLYPVEWHKAGHLPSTIENIAGLKFNISSNYTCNSENKATYTLQVLATKAFNNSAFYCAAYESCIDCPETECKCGCVGMCYSRPAFLKVEAVATTPHPTPTTPHTVQEMTATEAITVTTTVTVAPTVTVTQSLTNSPTPGDSLVEKIAVGVSVTLYIIITAVIVLLMVCCFLHWKYSSGSRAASRDELCVVNKVSTLDHNSDENTPTKGLLSKLIQPELNNFTTLHSSADVMEPIETHAVPTGRNQASKNETEIAVADAPSQRRREECRLLSHNDTNCFCSIVEAINHFVNNHSTS